MYKTDWSTWEEQKNQIDTDLITIFPNPFINTITLLGKLDDVDITVYDAQGRLIIVKQNKKLPIKINCKSFNPGVYIVSVFDNIYKKTITKKIIKK